MSFFGTRSPAPAARVVPMIAYEDGVTAMEWLVRAFGFAERSRLLDSQGRLAHAEMTTPGGGVVMLASPSPDYESPRRHREHCPAALRWQSVPWVVNGVLVYVDDVAAHLEKARREGAMILSELETDAPGPRYRAEDPEGHRWMFLQPTGH